MPKNKTGWVEKEDGWHRDESADEDTKPTKMKSPIDWSKSVDKLREEVLRKLEDKEKKK